MIKLLPTLYVWMWSCQNAQSVMYGYQSGSFRDKQNAVSHDTSNSYASSLFYDVASKSAYVVGSTYWSYWDRHIHTDDQVKNLSELDESDCFFAIISVPTEGDTMRLDYSRRFGKNDVNEACTAVTAVRGKTGNTRVITSGHTEDTGILTSLRSLGAPKSSVYGFLLDLEFGDNNSGTLSGGNLINDHTVQYPIALANNPSPKDDEEEAFYVVALSSHIKSKNPIAGDSGPRPDKAVGGTALPEYGSHYSAYIKKIVPKTQAELDFDESEAQSFDLKNDEGGLKETFRTGWTKLLSPKISLDSISIEHYLQIVDLKFVPRKNQTLDTEGSLILAGTTSGYGKAFGALVDNEEDDESFRYKSGFITIFDLDGAVEASVRIEIDEQDVVIKGVCFEERTDVVESFYVVGETRGLLADNLQKQDLSKDASGRNGKHAFLAKIDINNLSRVWTRQIGGALGKDVFSEGCAVSPGGDAVYMAGTVSGGDKIRLETSVTESGGGDDVFVANYGANGNQNYVNQMGSSRDDWLARGNGIVTDDMGNALVLGNSKGSMMRWRGDEYEESSTSLSTRDLPSDIFLFSVDKITGSMKAIAETTKDEETVTDDSPSNRSMLKGVDVIAVIVGASIVVLSAYYVGYRIIFSKSYKDGARPVVDYLDDFKDNVGYEVHIRHSATGGVQAVYGNKNIRQHQGRDQNGFSISKGGQKRSVDFEIAEVTRETRNLQKPRSIPPLGAFSVDSASALSFDASCISEDDLSWGREIL